ncbi:MAG: agmatinase [Candidatus Bathyarchaeota archaeon]|nr:agmatinase [Candidatus Bathyarchaeota archaeon]
MEKKIKNLFTKSKNEFLGFLSSFDEADYVILGFPFDFTCTYRFGCSKAPDKVRDASLNIETYSFRFNFNVENLKIYDAGNIKPCRSIEEALTLLEKAISSISKAGKIPVTLGGEHTLTYGVVNALKRENLNVICFDAHLDLRDTYLSRRLSHTTFMRRIAEKIGGKRIFLVGVRAACKEEVEFAEKNRVKYLTTFQVRSLGVDDVSKVLREFTEETGKVYISLDMDVLDPAYAPAVSNPEPDGLDFSTLFNILYGFRGANFLGFDVVEVAPDFDFGVTSIQAAKAVFEILCLTRKG